MWFLQEYSMDKNELSAALACWIKTFINSNFSHQYELLEVLNAPIALSKLNSSLIKALPNYSSWEFSPDLLGIIKRKSDGETCLVLINRSTSGLSLKEIGELHCYAKLVKAEFAFLVSSNGVSNEVNILLVDKQIRDRLLNFDNGKTIIILTWNENTGGVDKNSVLPIEVRHYFN
jgi:hypothetical protein